VHGGLLVCGTSSDAGKSVVVAGLCRVLARRGVKVAPFKAQNMSLNSAVAIDGGEIGRAQALQASAAGIEPETIMNPILLKPMADGTSQVIVRGQATQAVDAQSYGSHVQSLWDVVLDSFARLRARFDVVVLEGAGGAAEINLLDRDVVNLPLARRLGLPSLLVADIDRGGVFASLYGSVALLPDDLRAHVRGFVINKFRGDASLLVAGIDELERRLGVPTLGVLPFDNGLTVDAEDSLALDRPPPRRSNAVIDVVVIRLPHISNFTDIDPLLHEREVQVRYVADADEVGKPDLVILPGTKATVDDLSWLRVRGLDDAIDLSGARVLGICGGYQMLGRQIVDHVESERGTVPGLGWLDASTTFARDKVTARRRGAAMGCDVEGYEIHHGRVERGSTSHAWLTLDGEHEGATDGRRVWGTSLHGIFENDAFRARFLGLATRSWSFAATREAYLDRLGDLVERNLDLAAVERLIADG
jgi:adenosylcobyric acid synthase